MSKPQTAKERLAASRADFQARYQAQLAKAKRWEELEERLRALTPKALDVLERILDNPQDPRLAMGAALALLRATGLDGLKPPSRPNRIAMMLEE